jgi:hypothetical protein
MAFSVASWNIAAVNNNPFEYWVTHDSPSYNSLMEGVQGFLDAPGDNDLPISQVRARVTERMPPRVGLRT